MEIATPIQTFDVSKQIYKDLGVNVQPTLSWTLHIDLICKKTYPSLSLIRRNYQTHHDLTTKRKLYITLVRSVVTYCSQLWRPNLYKDIIKLEKVRRQATKYILNKNSIGYKTRLLQTHLLPLVYWFKLKDILFAIKCFKDPSENFDIKNYLSFSSNSTRSNSTQKLKFKHV